MSARKPLSMDGKESLISPGARGCVQLQCPVCQAPLLVSRRAYNIAEAPPMECWADGQQRWRPRKDRALHEETVQCDVCTTVSDVVRRKAVANAVHRRPIVLAPRLSDEQRNVLILRIGLGVTVPAAVVKAAEDLERAWAAWLKDKTSMPSEDMLDAMSDVLTNVLGREADLD